MPDLLKTLTIEADLHEVLLISLWYRKIAPQVNFNIAKKIQGVSLRCIYRGFFFCGVCTQCEGSSKTMVCQHTSQLETF